MRQAKNTQAWLFTLFALFLVVAWIVCKPEPGWAQEIESLERSDSIIQPRGWVFPDGHMLVVIAYDIRPSSEDSEWAGAVRWGVTPSQRSTGEYWPVARAHALTGTSGWGRGLVMLYGPAYEPLDIGDPNFLARSDYISSDTGWTANSWFDAARFGTGLDETTSFAPQLVLSHSAEMRAWILRLMDAIGQEHGVATILGIEVYGEGALYLEQALPGIRELIPTLFGADDSPDIAATDSTIREDPPLIETTGGVPWLTMLVEGVTGLFGLSDKQATTVFATIIAAVIAVAVVAITRVAVLALPVAWTVILAFWWVGWMSGLWVGIISAVAAIMTAWMLFLKRGS